MLPGMMICKVYTGVLHDAVESLRADLWFARRRQYQCLCEKKKECLLIEFIYLQRPTGCNTLSLSPRTLLCDWKVFGAYLIPPSFGR